MVLIVGGPRSEILQEMGLEFLIRPISGSVLELIAVDLKTEGSATTFLISGGILSRYVDAEHGALLRHDLGRGLCRAFNGIGRRSQKCFERLGRACAFEGTLQGRVTGSEIQNSEMDQHGWQDVVCTNRET